MAISTPNTNKHSWEKWHGIEEIEIDAAQTPHQIQKTNENSFDTRWIQAQKVVTGSGQIATPEAIEAVFPNIDA